MAASIPPFLCILENYEEFEYEAEYGDLEKVRVLIDFEGLKKRYKYVEDDRTYFYIFSDYYYYFKSGGFKKENPDNEGLTLGRFVKVPDHPLNLCHIEDCHEPQYKDYFPWDIVFAVYTGRLCKKHYRWNFSKGLICNVFTVAFIVTAFFLSIPFLA